MTTSDVEQPDWLWEFLGTPRPREGQSFELGGKTFVLDRGIPRSQSLVSQRQADTREAFGYKWQRTDTFDSDASLKRMRAWLVERYGDLSDGAFTAGLRAKPVVLDAGCGAAMSALELFGPALTRVRYLGVDVSAAIDVAATRFRQRKMPGATMQCDLGQLPFAPGSVDVIFSEGVLHHTDSTERALKSLVPLLAPGGRFMFYVYRKKGPVREFVDDLLRDKLQHMSPEEGWKALEPLTRLGIALGELKAEIDIPEDIALLEIPKGRIDVQRLFYWHVAKAFYRPDLTLDEMNHINFDWYAPANAHRQSPEQVRSWCQEAGLEIEREIIEEAGITIVARKQAR